MRDVAEDNNNLNQHMYGTGGQKAALGTTGLSMPSYTVFGPLLAALLTTIPLDLPSPNSSFITRESASRSIPTARKKVAEAPACRPLHQILGSTEATLEMSAPFGLTVAPYGSWETGISRSRHD
jgi:hypothetical protein